MDKHLALCFTGPNGTEQCVNQPPRVNQGEKIDPSTVIRNGLTILIVAAVVIVIIYIIWGATRWIRSRGDKQQVQAARSGITYALIGLVIVFLSFFMISVLGYVFNVNIFF